MTQPPDIPEKEIRQRCAHFITAATEEARRLGHSYIGVEHLFIAATKNESGATSTLLKRALLNPRTVRNEIRREIGTGEGNLSQDTLPLTPRTGIVLLLAINSADQDEVDDVDESHLLLAILQEGESVPIRKLIEMNFNVNHWLQRLLSDAYERDLASPSPIVDDDNPFLDLDDDSFSDDFFLSSPPPSFAARSNGGKPPTPLLDKYGRDLTAQAANGKIAPAIARDTEIRAVARTLARSKKNNPLLLGDAGVGKTAVVEGLAYAIHDGSAPESLLARRIIQIEIGTLVAGTSLRGQFEERLIGIVEEARQSGNVILFIDEIHTIVGAGDTIDSNLDAANILKPALSRGEIVCIGATTHEEYRRAIAQDPALDRRFRPIDIDEPREIDALAILTAQRERLEAHHKVTIRPETLEAAVKLSVRYLTDRRLPDKAIDLIDEACARVVIRTISPDEEETSNEVHVENIAAVLSEWTGIPINELTRDEKRRLANLENILLKRVIGQDEAIQTVAGTIKTARAGLNDPNRPVGVFLFLGPSGVGKTELARALANFMFGNDDAILRFDMSEFHDAHTVARLIGAPPGYKDSNRGGQLTDRLRRRPYSVILLDEVEKAAPEVFDLFLQVFDEGLITDSQGGHVDARHSLFIMTSNIGTEENSKSLGFAGGAERQPDFSAYLGRFFRPEFLNRIDEVVTFRALKQDTLSKILDLQLNDLKKRLADQHLTIELTDKARALILEKGYDAANGARPLRRAIERLLTRPLSAKIVEDAFNSGDTVTVDATDNQTLSFQKAHNDIAG